MDLENDDVERELVDYLKLVADQINEEFTDILCSVDVFPPSDTASTLAGTSVSLECILQNADADNADLISLGVDIRGDTHSPRMTVDVAWGNPYAKAVYELFPNPVAVTDENLRLVRTKMSELVSRLREEIRKNPRGKQERP
jgi:hypothetical protein